MLEKLPRKRRQIMIPLRGPLQILWPSVFRFLLMHFSIWVYYSTVANRMPMTKADRITIDKKT